MKHKVSELEGVLLDAAVAKVEGRMPAHGWDAPGLPATPAPLAGQFLEYSTDWADGGEIIEREKMDVRYEFRTNEWVAVYPSVCAGPTFLIAAMRAYVASKFGDEVELP